MIIDPVVSYSTYLGGRRTDYGTGIAVDSAGNAYVTGYTYSSDFPATPEAHLSTYPGIGAVFISKLNASGTALIYSTYVGTADDSSYGEGIAVDASGNALVTGYTYASDFPTTEGAFQTTLSGGPDTFVLKLNSAGSELIYSTLLGGSNYDYPHGIAVDSSGNALIAGHTFSTGFPVANAFQAALAGYSDAFVTKLNPTGTGLVFSTYLGGSGSDFGYGVGVDPLGNTYVTGDAGSGFPTTPNGVPTSYTSGVFAAKFDPAGAIVYSTLIGVYGSGYGVAVDSSGCAFVTGCSYGSDQITANAYQTAIAGLFDAFVAKLNSSGDGLVYFTYLGGTGYDYARSIAIDQHGIAHITGDTDSIDLPTAYPTQSSIGSAHGVYRTTNGGSNWDLANTGLPSSGITALATDPTSPSTVYAGNASGVYKSTDGGNNWWRTGNGPLYPQAIVIHPSNPAKIYAGASCSGVYVSTNGGYTWTIRPNGLTDPCVYSLGQSASDPATLYAGTQHGLFKTTDGGNSWSAAGMGLPQDPYVRSLVVDPTSSRNAYVAHNASTDGDNHWVYKTTDGGANWNAADTGLPSSGAYYNNLALDPANPSTLYYSAGNSNNLYKTTDGGNSWGSIGYPGIATRSLAIGGGSPATIYAAGADYGYGSISKSTDGGMTWSPASAGIVEDTSVWKLAISASDPAGLYAGLGTVQSDAFVARLDPSGSYLLFSTFLGSASSDYGTGIATDPAGDTYITGHTFSIGFPVAPGAFQPFPGAYEDAFLTRVTRMLRLAPDFEAGGKNNLAVYRPDSETWYSLSYTIPGEFTSRRWGMAGDLTVAGDYDGDGRTDIAVWRPASGEWYILPSNSPGSYWLTHWGVSTDKPVPADYDGDGKTDIAVWRPASGEWYILTSRSPGSYTSTQWGTLTDVPVPGDYDGDGKTDIAVWRSEGGTWFIIPSYSPGTFAATQWGLSTDILTPGDYDGDGKTDIAVWRPESGMWSALPTSKPGAYTQTQWGMSGDVPISSATGVLRSLP